jgi:uncharacterized protein (DUF1684 family)
MPRSNCSHFPDGQPAPGQVRPGLEVGDPTSELTTFFLTDQPAPGQVRPGLGVGDATFELPKFSQLPSLNLAKYDQDWAWVMPRSNCPHFPNGPACTRPSATWIGRGRCHVRIAHVFPTPSLNLAKYDQDWAWVMPRSNCPHFPDGPACTRPSATCIGRGRCHVRIAHNAMAKRTSKLGIACLGAGGEPHGAPF